MGGGIDSNIKLKHVYNYYKNKSKLALPRFIVLMHRDSYVLNQWQSYPYYQNSGGITMSLLNVVDGGVTNGFVLTDAAIEDSSYNLDYTTGIDNMIEWLK